MAEIYQSTGETENEMARDIALVSRKAGGEKADLHLE
jgi:hypothetical protein